MDIIGYSDRKDMWSIKTCANCTQSYFPEQFEDQRGAS